MITENEKIYNYYSHIGIYVCLCAYYNFNIRKYNKRTNKILRDNANLLQRDLARELQLLRTILSSYRDFEERVYIFDEKLPAIELVRKAILSKIGKFTKAEFNARVKIYQSINPSFNPDVEFAKDPIYRDIPSVDKSLFAIARKWILDNK